MGVEGRVWASGKMHTGAIHMKLSLKISLSSHRTDKLIICP
uniref:Uncharacterized protein n=1 Tax=Rhizophora mucronata TaxID=61149 RepID=A0A2P2NEB8_RHIMU